VTPAYTSQRVTHRVKPVPKNYPIESYRVQAVGRQSPERRRPLEIQLTYLRERYSTSHDERRCFASPSRRSAAVSPAPRLASPSQGRRSSPRSKVDPKVKGRPQGQRSTPRSMVDPEVIGRPRGQRSTPRSKGGPRGQRTNPRSIQGRPRGQFKVVPEVKSRSTPRSNQGRPRGQIKVDPEVKGRP
jgi:hypothetical protein